MIPCLFGNLASRLTDDPTVGWPFLTSTTFFCAVTTSRAQTSLPYRVASALTGGFLGLLYPRNCAGCEEPLDGDGDADRTWLCQPCESRLHRIAPPYCGVCGQSYAGEVSEAAARFRCGNCADLDLAFDFAVGAYRNEGLARELIHRFKYGRQHALCALLGELLRGALTDDRLAGSLAAGERWTLVPVPLHGRRLRDRGFNQAAELCRVLRRSVGDAFDLTPALRRVRHTGHQAALDRGDRLSNLQGAFALAPGRRLRSRIAGRSVLLVDDVLTTGATAAECARVLVETGGAAKVVVITVVRG